MENKAGQPFNAIWYEQIVSDDGQIVGYDLEGTEFWCTKTSASRTSKQFRSGIEGKTVNMILGSTNVSKLIGIEEGAKVLFQNKKYQVSYVEYDDLKEIYMVALT